MTYDDEQGRRTPTRPRRTGARVSRGRAGTLALVVLPLLVWGCFGAPRPRDGGVIAGGAGQVPDRPPSGIPAAVAAEIYAAENVVSGAPHVTGRIPRDVVVLAFRRGTTPEEKRQVVERVRGRVIGGAPISDQAFYYVRVPHDGGVEALFRAIAILRADPRVASAEPDLHLMLGPDAGSRAGARQGTRSP